MKRKHILAGLAVLAGLAALFWVLPVARPLMWLARKTLGAAFPAVKQITPGELDTWLQDSRRPPPQLLDARTEAEFAVSHLARARRVDPSATALELLPTLNTNQPVVVYCAVGYRASLVALRLQRAGFTNVQNLEGAIFAWASEGRPLVRGTQPAARVHPYNLFGRKLLDPRYVEP